ncbi:MAG: type I-E CRISPR-associated protein Cas7/Cse4/CasC [Deltaproteobacteria bacterium]|nr:type I-E CRISPR-associated protein Cas7/Cse4/CasC [Deltaproteobacteria bacterium]
MSDSTKRGRNVFVEFHVLRSYAPGNMNRDDLGTPKTAMFGGVRRLRLSSQCVKRTWRVSEHFTGTLGREALGVEVLGVRTKRLPERAQAQLGGELAQDAIDGLTEVLQRIGRKDAPSKDDEKTTAHLLFLTHEEIAEVAAFAKKNKGELAKLGALANAQRAADAAPAADNEDSEEDAAEEPKAKGAKSAKGAKGKGKGKKTDSGTERQSITDAMLAALTKHLHESAPRNAVDVALFGRFVTSTEFKSVDAAMQVAHALGTQKVDLEYDYFTAVDDLKPKGEDAGAGHLGETEFAQSVLYQYAVCDWRSLLANLEGYEGEATRIAAQSMRAVALAACRSVPRGKENGTAPQNPADYLEIVVRRDAPMSLANAFLQPVRAIEDTDSGDVMDQSIHRLRGLATKYQAAYSTSGDVIARLVLSMRDLQARDAKDVTEFATLDEIAKRVASVLEAEA